MVTRIALIADDSGEQFVASRTSVVVRNNGGTRSVIEPGHSGKFVIDKEVTQGGSGDGPSPLQAVVAALCACEAIIFERFAKKLEFGYEGIRFEASYTNESTRRDMDRVEHVRFQTIRMKATVRTDGSERQLRKIVDETERSCPVFNLVRDAGVNLVMIWLLGPRTPTNIVDSS